MTAPAVEYVQEFVDRDSDTIGLHIYPEPREPAAPVAVILPGMGVPARYYRPFALRLRAAGLAVVVVDLRGTGSSTPAPSRRSSYGYAELTSDVAAVLDALKARLDGRRVVLVGHSLGGQLSALHLALTNDRAISGLALIAVGLPWHASYHRLRSWGVFAFTQSIAGIAAVLRVWPGWGFGGRQAHRVMRDWGFTARHGRFPSINGRDVDALLAHVTTPVLAISVESDQYTPPMTLDHLCAKLVRATISRVHLTAAEEGVRLDHFTWARAATSIPTRVARFAASLAVTSLDP